MGCNKVGKIHPITLPQALAETVDTGKPPGRFTMGVEVDEVERKRPEHLGHLPDHRRKAPFELDVGLKAHIGDVVLGGNVHGHIAVSPNGVERIAVGFKDIIVEDEPLEVAADSEKGLNLIGL